MDMKQLCIGADVIAQGSADQEFEGCHYYRSLCLHRECFDALVQLRIESITNNYNEIDATLLAYLHLQAS